MKKLLLSLLPVTITFGPIFIGMSAPASSAYWEAIGLVAAVGLAAGLAAMFKILMGQQKEILRLGRLLAVDDRSKN